MFLNPAPSLLQAAGLCHSEAVLSSGTTNEAIPGLSVMWEQEASHTESRRAREDARAAYSGHVYGNGQFPNSPKSIGDP